MGGRKQSAKNISWEVANRFWNCTTRTWERVFFAREGREYTVPGPKCRPSRLVHRSKVTINVPHSLAVICTVQHVVRYRAACAEISRNSHDSVPLGVSSVAYEGTVHSFSLRKTGFLLVLGLMMTNCCRRLMELEESFTRRSSNFSGPIFAPFVLSAANLGKGGPSGNTSG